MAREGPRPRVMLFGKKLKIEAGFGNKNCIIYFNNEGRRLAQHSLMGDDFTSASVGGGSFVQLYSDEGAPYYWCSVTGRSMWASPTDWTLHHDPSSGAPFWSNSITGESAWAEESSMAEVDYADEDDAVDDRPPLHAARTHTHAAVASWDQNRRLIPQQQPQQHHFSRRPSRTLNEDGIWAMHPDAGLSGQPSPGLMPAAFRAAASHKHVAAAAAAAQRAAIEGAGAAALAERNRRSTAAAAAELAKLTASQAAWAGGGSYNEDIDSAGEAEGSTLSTAAYAVHASKRERRARAEKTILEKRRVEPVAFHPGGIDAAALGVSPGSPESPMYAPWEGPAPQAARSRSALRAASNRLSVSAAGADMNTPSESVSGHYRGFEGLSSGGTAAASSPFSEVDFAAESYEERRPPKGGSRAKKNSGGAKAPHSQLGHALTQSGRDLESDADPGVIYARRTANDFVGMTLTARSEWLRDMLSGLGDTVAAQAQILAIFLTSKSLPFLTNFFAATAGGTVEALKTVRRVVSAARSTLTPTGELPRSLQHAAALCAASVSSGSTATKPAAVGAGAAAPPRAPRLVLRNAPTESLPTAAPAPFSMADVMGTSSWRRSEGEGGGAWGAQAIRGQPKNSDSLDYAPHSLGDGNGGDAGYATAASPMASPSAMPTSALTCRGNSSGDAVSPTGPATAPSIGGGGSLADRLFAPAMVAKLLGPAAVYGYDNTHRERVTASAAEADPSRAANDCEIGNTQTKPPVIKEYLPPASLEAPIQNSLV
jgi:hypothetical protein